MEEEKKAKQAEAAAKREANIAQREEQRSAQAAADAKKPKAASSKYSQREIKDLKKVFDEYDKDRSGKISLAEFTDSLKKKKADSAPRAGQKSTLAQRKAQEGISIFDLSEGVFHELDIDGDGEVTFLEILKLMCERLNHPTLTLTLTLTRTLTLRSSSSPESPSHGTHTRARARTPPAKISPREPSCASPHSGPPSGHDLGRTLVMSRSSRYDCEPPAMRMIHQPCHWATAATGPLGRTRQHARRRVQRPRRSATRRGGSVAPRPQTVAPVPRPRYLMGRRRQSDALSRTQPHSTAIRRTQTHSDAISRTQPHSAAFSRPPPRPPAARPSSASSAAQPAAPPAVQSAAPSAAVSRRQPPSATLVSRGSRRDYMIT